MIANHDHSWGRWAAESRAIATADTVVVFLAIRKRS